MNIWRWIILFFIVLFGFVVFRGAPYVPSQRKYLRQALTELYPLSDKDVLVDVGSGDGVVLRMAASMGARAVGYELNPLLALISRLLSISNQRISVKVTDFWLTALPEDTTVVYVFMVSRYVNKFITKMQEEADRLGKPLYVIILGNEMEGRVPVAKISAYFLYVFDPVHTELIASS